ncbi:hypothetical protein QMZ92_30830 [Streptomyces sp. HNM0645]|nr:hypothetical protein [Streptomyces sp. HNM0645]
MRHHVVELTGDPGPLLHPGPCDEQVLLALKGVDGRPRLQGQVASDGDGVADDQRPEDEREGEPRLPQAPARRARPQPQRPATQPAAPSSARVRTRRYVSPTVYMATPSATGVKAMK